MREERATLQPKLQGMPVDPRYHLNRHQRISKQHSSQLARIQVAALKRQRRVEQLPSVLEVLHVYRQRFYWRRKAPVVGLVHAHEWRDMKVLCELPSKMRWLAYTRFGRQHIAVLLTPGRVIDFGNDRQ